MSRTLNWRRGGWSMVETLIVIAIAGILSTMTVSYLISAFPHAELERAEIEVTRALTEARNTSISEECQTRVEIFPETAEYSIERYDRESDTWSLVGAVRQLSEKVDFDPDNITFDNNRVIFTPRGTLVTGGTIGLINTASEASLLEGHVATGRFSLSNGGNLR